MIGSLIGSNKKQRDELRAMLDQARDERAAMSSLLTQIAGGTSRLAQTSKALDQVGQKAELALRTMDELGRKVSDYDERSKGIESIETRIALVVDRVAEAERLSERITAPDGELQKHRLALNQLASRALETQATVETLRKEHASFEDLRGHLKDSTAEVARSVASVATIKGELDSVRSSGAQLTQELQRIRDTSRQAKDDSAAATDAVREVEKKLGPLVQLQELSKNADERLASLNALAEHVSQKVKALEAQKLAVDRAVVEANRLNEMVWSMDAQVAKLNEGMKHVARVEESVERMVKLTQDTSAQLSAATSSRDEFAREFARLDKESRGLSEHLKSTVERLSLDKKELEAFDLRLRGLSSAVGEAEVRMEGVLGKDKALSSMSQHVGELGRDFQTLMAQADEMMRKQSALEAIGERLAEVDELGRRAMAQHESWLQSRQDVDTLRTEIAECHKSLVEAAVLRDKLSADRAALESFGERTVTLMSRTPELESKMDAVLSKVATVEEGAKSATRLGELAAEFDAQLTRVGARLQFVEKLEGRINSLHLVTSDVDRKLAEQLARRNEVESLKSLCDTLGTQVGDAQQRLDGVTALQVRLMPLAAQVTALGQSIERSHQLVRSVKYEEAAVHGQRAQLTELVEQSKRLASETTERLKLVQKAGDELGRAAGVKEELLSELARVQTSQRDAVTQTEAAEDQLKRAETMVKRLEQRRTQLAFSEKKISSFEQRLSELTRATEGVDQKIRLIAERESLVQAVKAEVEGVHKISALSRADLQFVTDHRADVTDLRGKVEDLLGRVHDTDAKLRAIESQRKAMAEVQARANTITNMLGDINVTLGLVAGRKGEIDQMRQDLAQLDFKVQEAKNAQRALQSERELADGRIEQGLKASRARSEEAKSG